MNLSSFDQPDNVLTIKEEDIEYIDDVSNEGQINKEGISVDDYINDLLNSSGADKEISKHQYDKSKEKSNGHGSNLVNCSQPLNCINHTTYSDGDINQNNKLVNINIDINQNNKLGNINNFTSMSLSTPSTSRIEYLPSTSEHLSKPSTSKHTKLSILDEDIFENENSTSILNSNSVIKGENNKKFRNDLGNTNINVLKTNVKNRLLSISKDGDGRKVKILKCVQCNEEFKGTEKDKEFYEHMMRHIDDPNLDYKTVYINHKKDKGLILKDDTCSCPICGKQFKSVRSMNAHQGMHTNYKRYTCSKCDAKFKLEADFKIHRYICINDTSNEVSNTYICQECGTVFKSKEMLIQHMNVHTFTPILPYKCTICDIDFEFLSGLSLHQKLMHTKTKKSEIRKKIISCHECGERFHRQCEKKRHMEHCIGSDRREEFQCNQCEMKFSRIGGLQLHKSILHR